MNTSMEIDGLTAQSKSRLGYWLLLTYLALEYGRPQSTFPFLEILHLPAIVSILIAINLLLSGRLSFSDLHTRLFLCLVGLMALHVPLAHNTYWAFQVGKMMLTIFLVYACFGIYVDSYKRIEMVLAVWLGIHIYLAISGVMKQGQGIGGFIADENDFCMTLNMILPFPFFLLLVEQNSWKKLLYAAMAGLFLAASVLTMSRGGFIGLVAVAAYCLFRSPRKLAAATALALLITMVVVFAPSQYFEEIQTIGEGAGEGTTGQDRVYIWGIGWQMFLDNPIIGIGQGNFPFRFRPYEEASGNEEGLRGRSRAGRAAHSLYFTLLPELGLVGTTIVFLMTYHTFRDLAATRRLLNQHFSNSFDGVYIRRMAHICFAVEASLIGYFVSGVFISILYYPNLWLMIGFAIALRNAARRIVDARAPSDQAEYVGTMYA